MTPAVQSCSPQIHNSARQTLCCHAPQGALGPSTRAQLPQMQVKCLVSNNMCLLEARMLHYMSTRVI